MVKRSIGVVGAGPAGCFICQELLRHVRGVDVHVYEKRTEPFGLVRYGVAPDHAHIRGVVRPFSTLLERPNVHFHGGCALGRTVELKGLLAEHEAVFLAVGAGLSSELGLPGEGLEGSLSGLDVAHWVNGLPEAAWVGSVIRGPSVVVAGHGNVALDAARLLLRDPGDLERTDIAPAALELLRSRPVREVHLVGRRGPAQSAFREPELRELASLSGVRLVVEPDDLHLDEEDEQDLDLDPYKQRRPVLELLRSCASRPLVAAPRSLYVHFRRSPLALHGERRVASVTLGCNVLKGPAGSREAVPTGETETLEAATFIRAVGHRVEPLPGVPFDESSGHIPARDGRVLREGRPVPRLYAAGWAARPARGLIGHNKPDARAAVRAFLEDTATGSGAETP